MLRTCGWSSLRAGGVVPASTPTRRRYRRPALAGIVAVAIALLSAAGAAAATVKRYPLGRDATDITTGHDGDWYVTYSGAVLRLAPSGRYTGFAIPGDAGGLPGSIVAGPENSVWFAYATVSCPPCSDQVAVGQLTATWHLSSF